MAGVAAAASPGRRSLAPREHGAYAQLGLPLVAAYVGGRPTVAAGMLGLAAVAAFLAHEPLLILLGHRGKRALAEARTQAARRLVGVAIGGVAAAGLAIHQAPAAAKLALLPAAAAVALVWLLVKRRERTVPGEILAAAALAGASLPVALACGWRAPAALAAGAGWIAGFAAVTSVVWPIAHKRPLGGLARTLALLIPALVVVVASSRLGAQAAAAGAPLIVMAAAVSALRPAARLLRPIGWTIAAASIAQVAAVVLVSR